jgi:hypothetical protein
MRSWRDMANSLPPRRICVKSKERPLYGTFSGTFSGLTKTAESAKLASDEKNRDNGCMINTRRCSRPLKRFWFH